MGVDSLEVIPQFLVDLFECFQCEQALAYRRLIGYHNDGDSLTVESGDRYTSRRSQFDFLWLNNITFFHINSSVSVKKNDLPGTILGHQLLRYRNTFV